MVPGFLFMNWQIRPGLGFGSFPTAWRTIQGYETMHMIGKGQIAGVEQENIRAQYPFVARLIGLVV